VTAIDGGTVALEPDDIALADRLKHGREQILTELRKVIIGQDDVVELVLLTLFVGGTPSWWGSRGWRRPS
jgi:hypothetical protein